jgi:anti-sigma B factor antagonist
VHATTEVRIHIEEREGVQLARTSGELDALGAPVLRECLNRRLFPGHDFVLDFDEVTFLGSAGMKVLIDTDERAATQGVRWALVGETRPVARPLRATGLAERLPLQPNVPTAIRVLVSHRVPSAL